MYSAIKQEDYVYKNCPIPGGGYVTGFVFHPKNSKILYARTDIGGVYRFDFENEKWLSLCGRADPHNMAQTFPLSIACDPDDDNILFIACGTKRENYLSVSFDRGESFIDKPLPCEVHGNEVGRSTGERLIFHSKTLWFASQTGGLFRSRDMGESWENISVGGEKDLTFIKVSPNGKLMIAGTSGEVCRQGAMRGCTLYFSCDGGESWQPAETPKGYYSPECTYSGFVPQKAVFTNEYLFITFAQSGKILWGGMRAYSCDTGSAYDGRVYRYRFSERGITFDKDVTPPDIFEGERRIKGAYCAAEYSDGALYVSTICRSDDIIYRSRDLGESWEKILEGLETGKFDWNVSYLKPEYHGGRSCVHWISDIKISPDGSGFAVFNTGTGIFFTRDITADVVEFAPLCDGLEETVHMNVYSLPNGKGKVLDLVGDLCGFIFTDLDKPCENSFSDGKGNRYITALNADFTDADANRIAVTARGNWTGQTKGGVILTNDQGESWKRLSPPVGINSGIDRAVQDIEKPNVDPGWVAMSADGERILWTLCCRQKHAPPMFRSDMTVFTDNEGESWRLSKFFTAEGKALEEPLSVKIFADRSDRDVFYALTNSFKIFVSTDKGERFNEIIPDKAVSCPPNMPPFYRFEARCQPNEFGVIWIANGYDGLYRLTFDKARSAVTAENMLASGDRAYTVGFGKGKNGVPAVFIGGDIGGKYGFYRSYDLCRSWVKINTDDQCFGGITSVCGDLRTEGRVFLATSTRGLIYGEQAK